MDWSLASLRSLAAESWKNMHSVCDLRTCRNTMLVRSVPQRRIGIQVGRLWYCSADCFAQAAVERLAELSDERIVEMPHRPRRSIGLVMVSKDYITGSELRLATAQSQLRGEEIEVTLVRMGLANERQLAAARAAQWGCPVLKGDQVSQLVDVDIPATVLRAASAVPLHYSPTGGRLVIGFVYRLEHTLLHALDQIVGCRAEPCFITASEFEQQKTRVMPLPGWQEVVVDELLTPGQMAKSLGKLAVDIAAREARFVHCKEYIWARLIGKQRRVDVLFRSRYEVVEEKPEDYGFQQQNIGNWG